MDWDMCVVLGRLGDRAQPRTWRRSLESKRARPLMAFKSKLPSMKAGIFGSTRKAPLLVEIEARADSLAPRREFIDWLIPAFEQAASLFPGNACRARFGQLRCLGKASILASRHR
jgi:hypothetical protein